uniref:Serine/threonine-protein phosphatase n=1 Tax=Ananas comosus var. bracteatus TaxID=296719 RepID=A0A6V7QXR3_ANACO
MSHQGEEISSSSTPPPPSSSSPPSDPTAASVGSRSCPNPTETPLAWPSDGSLTREWIAGLTAALDWSSRHLRPPELPSVLPLPLLQRLVLAASNILHKEPNCLRIDMDGDDDAEMRRSGAAVVVVGDVHGQFHDVIFLLEHAGFPSENRIFVFNGDYVDRGAWGLETFLLLLAWKVFLPHRVFLLRGNHESKYCTSVYGFEKEVMVKYGDQGPQVYRKCRVYTAHGGLFRSVSPTPSSKRSKGKKGRKVITNVDTSILKLGSLEELLKARRTVLDPPWEGSNLIPGDVLWSDPSPKPGLSLNEERGIGLLWGPDCTEEFLKKYNLKLIIRSHEGPDARDKRHDLAGMDNGYTIDHQVESGKLITLFSAPDYPQFQATEERYNNRGAYIVLHFPDFTTPEFHSFEAVKPRPKVGAYYNFEEVIDSDEELDLQSMDNGSSLDAVASTTVD